MNFKIWWGKKTVVTPDPARQAAGPEFEGLFNGRLIPRDQEYLPVSPNLAMNRVEYKKGVVTFNVSTAENGFILTMSDRDSVYTKNYVCSDLRGVADQFVAAMVARRLSAV